MAEATMRVLINSWLAYPLKTGVGFYVEQLVEHLRRLVGGEAVEPIVCSPPLAPGRLRLLRSSLRCRRAAGRSASPLQPLLRAGWESARELALRFAARAAAAELYHEPNYIPAPCRLPTVVTVHDLSLLVHPEWHPRDRVRYFERHFGRRLRWVRRFIAVSAYTRTEMIRHLGLPADAIDVVHLAARPAFRPMPPQWYRPLLRTLGLPDSYLLFVGTIEPRKNVSGLVEAYMQLPAPLRARYPLVIVGRWGWGYAEAAARIERLNGQVRLIGYVSEQQLVAIYNGAAALVYPSWYEGFGLPPLEMMACGRPVIASNRTSLPEVLGDAALMVDPEHTESIAAAIRTVLEEPELAERLGRRGLARAAHFSWLQTAARTAAVYRKALGIEPSQREPSRAAA